MVSVTVAVAAVAADAEASVTVAVAVAAVDAERPAVPAVVAVRVDAVAHPAVVDVVSCCVA